MYIFGGFSSVLLNDILVYKPPNCEAFRDEELCKNARPGIRCLWNKKHCESWESGNANNILRAKCPKKTGKSCLTVWNFWCSVGDRRKKNKTNPLKWEKQPKQAVLVILTNLGINVLKFLSSDFGGMLNTVKKEKQT